MKFEDMSPLQRRMHNASIVLDAEGDEHGFVGLLREAIATEEAQIDEAVVWADSLDCVSVRVRRSDERAASGDGVKELFKIPLFTRPAPPLAGEHAALCYRLKEMAKAMTSYGYAGCAGLCIEAADTLAADAQEIERKYISPVHTIADLVNNLLLMDQALPIYGAQYIDHPTRGRCAIAVSPTLSRERVQDSRWIGQGNELNAAIVWTRAAQQVAVPHGLDEDTLRDMAGSAFEEAMAFGISTDSFERLARSVNKRALAAAPHPPKADALSADHGIK